jgi:hypothetical protein
VKERDDSRREKKRVIIESEIKTESKKARERVCDCERRFDIELERT